MFVFGSGACLAQSTNAGDIRGSVTDASGALIPGVKVTVLNVDTGVANEYTTNNSGLYDTNSIIPGHYQITFTRDGFDVLVRGPITLEVGFTTVNGQLKIGSTNEQITVTSDVPLLTTENGEQTTVLDAKSMDELPQVTPNWESFVILLPGAAGTSSSSPGQQAAINGNLPYSNVLSDGASTTLGQSMNANTTTFEDVAELQINTSSFSAQYGIGGVIFNQVTKSGTSSFHGTGYDIIQNGAFNAAPYTVGGGGLRPKLRYNNFGGSLGGPVLKMKKMFFYFNYDHIINNGFAGGLNEYTVPTPKMMTGDFSEIAGTTTLYDPTTQTIAYDANGNPYPVRQPYMTNGVANVIPTSELDSVASKFIQWYPTPTNHIAGGNFLCGTSTTPVCTRFSAHGEPYHNFGSDLSSPNPTTRYFGRLDYDITPKNRLTMSEVETDNPSIANGSGVEACPVGCGGSDYENNNSQITDVWTISPRMVNEARLGYTYQFSQAGDESFGKGLPAQLGWKFAKRDDFPDIDFEDGDWDPAWINKQANGGNLYKEHVFDPSDVVTLIVGKHILHFGGEVLMYRNDSFLWGQGLQSGALAFGGNCGCNHDYTAHWTTDSSGAASIPPENAGGWAMADFMLGYASGWSASVTPEFGARLKSPQLFVQDDYKIRPTLTVNLGLRYQINHGWNEIRGDEDTFDPTVMNPATNTLGAMWFGQTHANGRTAMEANKFDTFLPRVGFSWLLDPKTTLRGGFGLYAYNWSADNYGNGIGAPFGGSGSTNDTTGGITPITQLDGPGTLFGTSTSLPFVSDNTAPDAYNGQNVSYTAYHTPVPKIMQWNLAVEREVAPNVVVELSYVASHAKDLVFGGTGGVALNQIPESELLPTRTNTAAIPYPNYAIAGKGGSITGYTNNAVANYNSLQAQITKRYHSGFSFNFNYVWSHMLDSGDSSGWGSHAGPLNYQNSYSPAANYASSNFDIRNSFKGYAVYQLPFGKGKPFLSHSALLDEAVGGWQISGTMILSTGNPFSLTATGNDTYANGGGTYPNWSGISPKVQHKSYVTWYNPAAFSQPADGTFGNVGRNALYGPGINVVGLAAHKEFQLVHAWDHDVKMQVRLDSTNAFNHPSFGQPSGVLEGSKGVNTSYTATQNTPDQINSVVVGGRDVQFTARITF
jgi:hypothetical protein